MLASRVPAGAKRTALRAALAAPAPARLPGAFEPLVARLIERAGFEGAYLSGAAYSAGLALPDIGLFTATELAQAAAATARATDLPLLVDADTGFGESAAVARTIQLLEDAGAAGCHIEDQVAPKRCGHLDGKQVVSEADAVRRLAAAVAARRDPAFVIVARTDIRGPEGLAACLRRAQALQDAGADAIFPEALADLGEFETVAAALDVPVIANMTEFGKTQLATSDELRDVGVAGVIYPVTLLRLALRTVRGALETMAAVRGQADLVPDMLTRAELYDLLDYAAYDHYDADIAPQGAGKGEEEK